jgi:hypothetical protein
MLGAAVALAVFAAGSSEAAGGAGCPRLADAASLPLRPGGGGALRGDFDGDGRTDVAGIRYEARAPASCGFVLVVKTRRRSFALRIPEWYKPPQDLRIRDWWLAEPFIGAVVELEPNRAQIVVARQSGASVVQVSFYGVVNGRLGVLRFRPRTYEDELSLFGTVGTGTTNVRCRRGGPLVVIGEWPTSTSGRRWHASRTTYTLNGNVFSRSRTRTVTGTWTAIDAVARRWGFGAVPFTGCIVERGRRLA